MPRQALAEALGYKADVPSRTKEKVTGTVTGVKDTMQDLIVDTLGALPFTARRARAQAQPSDQTLLFVITASGGASILDSFLPILSSQAGGGVRSYQTSQVVQPPGSNLKGVAVDPLCADAPRSLWHGGTAFSGDLQRGLPLLVRSAAE